MQRHPGATGGWVEIGPEPPHDPKVQGFAESRFEGLRGFKPRAPEFPEPFRAELLLNGEEEVQATAEKLVLQIGATLQEVNRRVGQKLPDVQTPPPESGRPDLEIQYDFTAVPATSGKAV